MRNAAKARIRRFVAEHSKRSDLEAPDWLAKEWHKGTAQREQMAATLQEVNWDKVGYIFNPMFPIPTIYDVTHACFFLQEFVSIRHVHTKVSTVGMSTTDL